MKYVNIEEVIKISGASQRYVMEEIKRGNLRAFKVGRRLRFDPEDIEKWIRKKAV